METSESPKTDIDLGDLGLALLGFASGCMDAFAFIALGQVFPSAMTGNTALFGLALGQGNMIAASRPLAAFAGFVVGAATAAAGLTLRLDKLPKLRAVCWLLTLEACLLAFFALAEQYVARPMTLAELYGIISLASSGMGIQSVAARFVGRPGVTTVVFTSTLTAIVTSATDAVLRPPHTLPFATKRQIGMFVLYGAGAVTSGLLALNGASIAFLPCAAVLAALVYHWRAEAAARLDDRGQA